MVRDLGGVAGQCIEQDKYKTQLFGMVSSRTFELGNGFRTSNVSDSFNSFIVNLS